MAGPVDGRVDHRFVRAGLFRLGRDFHLAGAVLVGLHIQAHHVVAVARNDLSLRQALRKEAVETMCAI
jgi:hypothetical protein